jgi:hypothetical protein
MVWKDLKNPFGQGKSPFYNALATTLTAGAGG